MFMSSLCFYDKKLKIKFTTCYVMYVILINVFYLLIHQDLVSCFNFHNYDNLRHFTKKHDPRRRLDDDDDPVSLVQQV